MSGTDLSCWQEEKRKTGVFETRPMNNFDQNTGDGRPTEVALSRDLDLFTVTMIGKGGLVDNIVELIKKGMFGSEPKPPPPDVRD